MKDLRVAVWGLGPHAIKNILPALAHASGLTLAGTCSRSAETVCRVANDFRCRGWTEPAEMLEDTLVDVVFVSTPIGLHFLHGKSVLGAGKHFWSEKPFAANLDQATALVTESRARRLTVAEGFMFLYHPQFHHVREAAESARLGKLRAIECRFGMPRLERPGFRDDPALGGGAFLDVGCYPIAAVVALRGADPEIELAEIRTDLNSQVDTEGRAVLRYDDGVSASLNWGMGRAYRNELDLWGTKGSLTTEKIFSKAAGYVPRFRWLDAQGAERMEEGVAGNHFVGMFESFAGLACDAGAAEAERDMIIRRATLADRIRNRSQA